MQKFAEQAVIDAWQYNRIVLDYSPESIEIIEQILTKRQKWIRDKNFTDKDIRAEALIAGAYIGETVKREKGGTWSESDEIAGEASYPLKFNDQNVYPYIWCYKRLTEGPEENVWHKYSYFVKNQTPPGVKIEVKKQKIGTNAQPAR